MHLLVQDNLRQKLQYSRYIPSCRYLNFNLLRFNKHCMPSSISKFNSVIDFPNQIFLYLKINLTVSFVLQMQQSEQSNMSESLQLGNDCKQWYDNSVSCGEADESRSLCYPSKKPRLKISYDWTDYYLSLPNCEKAPVLQKLFRWQDLTPTTFTQNSLIIENVSPWDPHSHSQFLYYDLINGKIFWWRIL